MLASLIGLFFLFLFYSGAYLLIKKYLKIAPAFILLFINLAIIFILFLAGLVGLLEQTVWGIGLSGVLYFTVRFFLNRQDVLSDVSAMLASWVQSMKFFYKKRFVLKSLLLLVLSSSCSFTLINLTLNIWVHPRWTIMMIFLVLSIFLFFTLSLLSFYFLNLLHENIPFRFLAIAGLILSAAFFSFVLTDNIFLVPRTDTIVIQAAEFVNGDNGEIILNEIKDLETQDKLEPEDIGQWQSLIQSGSQVGLKSQVLGDPITYFSSRKGPSEYNFIFTESPSSGTVEIRLNGNSYSYNLKNVEVNQRNVRIASGYLVGDVFVLGVYFIFSLAMIQAILALFYTLWMDSNALIPQKYRAYMILLILAVVLFLITRPMYYWEWDEFSHWGTFIKELSIKNQLPLSNFCTTVPRYIPGITLIEYFFIKFLGYKEGHAYFAYLFFVATIIGAGVVKSSKNIFYSILYFCAVFFVLFFLPLKFFSLYVDAPLGLLFGTGIVYVLSSEDSQHYYVSMFLIFCGLQLMKTWGLVFSVFIAGIYILERIIKSFKEHIKLKDLLRNLLPIFLVLILSIVLTELPWQLHLQKNQIEILAINGENLVNINSNENGINIKKLVSKWIETTLKGRADFGLYGLFSIFNLSLFFLIVGVLISGKNKTEMRATFFIYLFFIVNIFLIFLTYIIYFPQDEGAKLASYERYTSEFFAGWILFIVYQISSCWERNDRKSIIFSITNYSLLGLVICSIPFLDGFIQLPPTKIIGRRESIKLTLEKYEDVLFDGNVHHIFHIAQNENGLSHHILRYELCLNTTQLDKWSFGDPYPAEIAATDTTNLSVNELEAIIQNGYDYVLITKPDNKLWNIYGSIFPEQKNQDESLFEVKDDKLIFVK